MTTPPDQVSRCHDAVAAKATAAFTTWLSSQQSHRPCLTQQLHRRAAFLLELSDRALLRRLVRAPAEERRAVTEAAAGEVVVLHFEHELRCEGLPFARALGAPS